MAQPSNYQPQYVSLSEVPIEVEDRYTASDKREAIFQAETAIEMDRNAGYPIDDEDWTNTHTKAVLNLATYYLVRSATANDDVTLGDLDDGGEQTERHAEQYHETYMDCLEQLAEAGEQKGQTGTYMGASGDTGGPVAVNSGPHARRHHLGTDDRHLVDEQYVADDS